MLKLFSATSRRCHPKLFLPTPRIGKTVTGDAYHETQPSLPAKHHTTTEPIINSAEPTELVADNSWPEWVNLLGQLSEQGYIEPDTPGDVKYSNKIRTACLNFARDRFDFIRYFSNKDLKVTVRHGCPSLDRKVVNSGKRLRAHLGIDEGSMAISALAQAESVIACATVKSSTAMTKAKSQSRRQMDAANYFSVSSTFDWILKS